MANMPGYIGPGQEIIVRIDPETGETKIEAVGFGGTGCKDASKPYEQALGNPGGRTMKPVAFRAVSASDEVHIEAKT